MFKQTIEDQEVEIYVSPHKLEQCSDIEEILSQPSKAFTLPGANGGVVLACSYAKRHKDPIINNVGIIITEKSKESVLDICQRFQHFDYIIDVTNTYMKSDERVGHAPTLQCQDWFMHNFEALEYHNFNPRDPIPPHLFHPLDKKDFNLPDLPMELPKEFIGMQIASRYYTYEDRHHKDFLSYAKIMKMIEREWEIPVMLIGHERDKFDPFTEPTLGQNLLGKLSVTQCIRFITESTAIVGTASWIALCSGCFKKPTMMLEEGVFFTFRDVFEHFTKIPVIGMQIGAYGPEIVKKHLNKFVKPAIDQNRIKQSNRLDS